MRTDNNQRRIAAGCAIAFVALTIVVWRHPLILGDARLDHRLLATPGSAGWHLAVIASFLASGPVVALVGLLMALWTVWRLRQPAGAIAIVVAPAIAGVIELAMKSVVSRARPVTSALSGESGNGYPSGHVTGFAAMVVAVLVVWVLQRDERSATQRSIDIVAVGLAIAIVAWSRVAIGAHYTTDVMGGALLGVAIGLTCPWVCAALWSRWRDRSRVAA
jgi:undecaprenyl-diphosphatase